MTNNQKINATVLLLRITYSVVPIVAGIDKFFNKLTYWPQYLHPAIANAIPFTIEQIMFAVGIIEIIAGVLVFTKTRLGAYIVALWLTGIAITLFSMERFYDIGVRDLVMAAGALSLAWLSEAQQK